MKKQAKTVEFENIQDLAWGNNETGRYSKVRGWSKMSESGRSTKNETRRFSKVCGNKQRLKSDRLKMRERSKRDESGRSQNVRVAIK